MMMSTGNCEDIEGGLSTTVSALEVNICESDTRRLSMMGAKASLPIGSLALTAACWASKTAGGVRTPECENMAGMALE